MLSMASPFAIQLLHDLSREDARRVLAVFREDIFRLGEVLRVSARAGDQPGFRRAAHGLAGAAGAVGAEELEQACRLAMSRHYESSEQFPAAAAEIHALATEALAALALVVDGSDV